MSNTKPTKLSAAVKAAVEAYGFLKTPMELGLVNYSALARQIKPALEKQMDQELTVEAIAMALHRHVEPQEGARNKDSPLTIVAACKVQLLPDMTTIHYPYSRKLQERVNHAKTLVENQGGNMYQIERMNEISVITQSQYLDVIKKQLADAAKPLEEFHNLSLITIQYPPECNKKIGVFNHFMQALNEATVNLLGVFTSYTKISFLVAEADAPRAYEKLNRAIAAAKALK